MGFNLNHFKGPERRSDYVRHKSVERPETDVGQRLSTAHEVHEEPVWEAAPSLIGYRPPHNG